MSTVGLHMVSMENKDGADGPVLDFVPACLVTMNMWPFIAWVKYVYPIYFPINSVNTIINKTEENDTPMAQIE